MAERWQQWMPFHIDRWRGSAHVQAMRAAARAGYLYLLASAWQSEDCSLPDETEELQVLAGMSEEEWLEHGARILRRFIRREDGRYVNEVLRAEWISAKTVYDKRHRPFDEVRVLRSVAGKLGARKRWSGEPARSERRDLESASGSEGTPLAQACQSGGKRMANDSQASSKPTAGATQQEQAQGQEQRSSELEEARRASAEIETATAESGGGADDGRERLQDDHALGERLEGGFCCGKEPLEAGRPGCSHPGTAGAGAIAVSPTFLELPLVGSKTHRVTEEEIAAYQQAYPAVDIRAELRKMVPWLDANPGKRSRTPQGSKRRIVLWLSRAQDAFQDRAEGAGGGHGGYQRTWHRESQQRATGSWAQPIRGQQRIEQALEELDKAGVRLTA